MDNFYQNEKTKKNSKTKNGNEIFKTFAFISFYKMAHSILKNIDHNFRYNSQVFQFCPLLCLMGPSPPSTPTLNFIQMATIFNLFHSFLYPPTPPVHTHKNTSCTTYPITICAHHHTTTSYTRPNANLPLYFPNLFRRLFSLLFCRHTCQLFSSLTHLLTHSLILSFTHSLTRSIAYSLTHPYPTPSPHTHKHAHTTGLILHQSLFVSTPRRAPFPPIFTPLFHADDPPFPPTLFRPVIPQPYSRFTQTPFLLFPFLVLPPSTCLAPPTFLDDLRSATSSRPRCSS